MSKITSLCIQFEHQGSVQVLSPVVISNSSRTVLVDVPYPDHYDLLEEALAKVELTFNDLTDIVITHHDIDHMGCLALIKEKHPHITVMSSRVEADYISGKIKSQRLVQAEELYTSLPDEEKPGALFFQAMLESVLPVSIDVKLDDGDLLPNFTDVKVLLTPGHTKGHISLLDMSSCTLVAGDALVIESNRLVIANPQYTLDMLTAMESIRKISNMGIQAVYCYHGGLWKGNIQQELEALSH